MGKSKDKKKKGKGMEKTIAKTEKKDQKRIKKELEELGEESIENLIAEFQQKDKELLQVKEELCQSPLPRTGASFNLHPEREEFIFFGGEYYNGSKIFMYNDLYIYSIKKNQWSLMKVPNSPPPRSSHQAVLLSRNQGELWIFGGEFASPSQTKFYHYNDLWVFRFATKTWEKINALNGPSPRSGHRMTIYNKFLLVFGGFHDNLRDCRYFNDVYVFNLETNQWQQIKFSVASELPSPRSACQLLVSSKNNCVVVYGGFSKEKVKKKDIEKGVVHTDMFGVALEVKKDGRQEWVCKKIKQTGTKPSDRCGFSAITLLDDTAVVFGGVYDYENTYDDDDENDDDDEDEQLKSVFHNDLYRLDLTNYKWKQITLKGKRVVKSTKKISQKKKADGEDVDDAEMSTDDENAEGEETVDNAEKKEDEKIEDDIDKLQIKENDDIFKISYDEKAISSHKVETDDHVVVNPTEHDTLPPFVPTPRRNAYLQFYKGILYVYGGCYEGKNGKEVTLTDMYSLNVKKLDEFKVLLADKNKVEDATASKQNESESDDDEDDDSEMEIDAPDLEGDEDLQTYFERTGDFWLDEAKKEFPSEKSKKILGKMAKELCNLFFESLKDKCTNDNENDEDD